MCVAQVHLWQKISEPDNELKAVLRMLRQVKIVILVVSGENAKDNHIKKYCVGCYISEPNGSSASNYITFVPASQVRHLVM